MPLGSRGITPARLRAGEGASYLYVTLARLDHVARFIVNANQSVPIRLAKLARSFQNSAHMKMTTLLLRNLMNRSPLRASLLIALALGWLALAPTARAVRPPPDGGYPNQNTAEGEDALFSLTTGTDNTAIGFDALFSNTTGSENTATGSDALLSNTTGIRNAANGFAALE